MGESKKLPGYSEQFKPDFYSTVSSFTVVMKNVNYSDGQAYERDADFGINGEINFGINGEINFGINEMQKKIIALLVENPRTTISAIAETLGMTKRNIENHISQLKESGVVEREGARKNGRWIVKSD